MIDLRPVLLIVGIFLATLGCAMMLPALYDLVAGNEDWKIFAASAVLTLFVGIGLAFANRGHSEQFTIRQGFLLSNLSWLGLTAFGALPFAWSQLDLSYTDAFFESMSGITTTGATVITKLDSTNPGILLWRGLLQWLGGLGIIVMAISVLPLLQVGGMQLFRVEGFETDGKIQPRATQIAGSLCLLYLVFTTICALAYFAAGMSLFDAVVHSMTTIATGGFSTRDASIAYFSNSWIEFLGIIFMIVGSLPFVLYLRAVRAGPGVVFGDSQVRWFFGTVVIFVVLAWLSYQSALAEPAATRFLTVVFNVVSIMTGTGYATTAYDNWSDMAVVVFFILMFIGGCSGSTSCGIKIFRFQVIFEMIRIRLRSIVHPKGVFIERYNGAPIVPNVTSAVMGFLLMFLLSFFIAASALTMLGLDILTATSAAASAIANVGPALGPVVGPVSNYAALPDMAKWILSFTMLLGRLEIMTVIVLLAPAFWRA